MLFSVIIPTYHRNDLLAKCLDCLKPEVQSIDQTLYEVIVTDDGSHSTAKGMIEQDCSWVNWVQGPQKGPAANRNNGAKYASGDWLIFFDDDCLPDSDVLENYLKAIDQYPEYKVFEGRIYADRPRKRLDEESPINETGGYLWSCNFAIEKDLFWKVGAFDEVFPYAAMEDVDLHYRLKALNHFPKFIQEANVCHPWRKIGRWKKFMQIEMSTKIYLKKHPNENIRLNKKHFTFAFFRTLLKVNFPGLFKYKFRGLNAVIKQQYHLLRLIFLC